MKNTSRIIAQAKKEKRSNLLEMEAKAICTEYGIPVARTELAKSPLEAADIAERIGYPVVMKIVSPEIVHKSDVGGVFLNLANRKSVTDTYKRILVNVKKHSKKARILGVAVQEMVPPSTEVIVGATKDPQFGPALMFGLGGVFVEVMKDVTFRIAPISQEEAREMISEVRAFPLLKGYRNTPPADINAIVKILLCTSKLVMDNREIKELDLNPIIVYKRGAKTVDARIILDL